MRWNFREKTRAQPGNGPENGRTIMPPPGVRRPGKDAGKGRRVRRAGRKFGLRSLQIPGYETVVDSSILTAPWVHENFLQERPNAGT